MKKISRIAKFLALSVSFMTPLLANAQINTTYIKGYSDSIINIINDMFVPVLMAIAFIVFLWGVYKYFILGAVDPKSQSDGRQFTLWGIIGFVVIVSVWAIVNLFTSTLGLSATNAPKPPTFGTGTTGNTDTPPPVYPPTPTVDAAKRASCLGSGGTFNSSNNTCACLSPKIWDGNTCATNNTGIQSGGSCTSTADCAPGLSCTPGDYGDVCL